MRDSSLKGTVWLAAIAVAASTVGGCGGETAGTGTAGTGAATAEMGGGTGGAGAAGAGTGSMVKTAPLTAEIPGTASVAPLPVDVATAAAAATRPPDIESKDILAREPIAPTGEVKHILVAWAELEPAFRGHMDPRAKSRTKDQADALAWDLYNELKAGKPIEPLMAVYSEDPGSARTGNGYPFSADAMLVPPFKNLSMRLNVGEVGIVQTNYGWHIIKRTS
jgi:hypothetical protein